MSLTSALDVDHASQPSLQSIKEYKSSSLHQRCDTEQPTNKPTNHLLTYRVPTPYKLHLCKNNWLNYVQYLPVLQHIYTFLLKILLLFCHYRTNNRNQYHFKDTTCLLVIDSEKIMFKVPHFHTAEQNLVITDDWGAMKKIIIQMGM